MIDGWNRYLKNKGSSNAGFHGYLKNYTVRRVPVALYHPLAFPENEREILSS
jgi:hypothetical protein